MSTRLSLRLVGEIQGGWRLDLDYECGKGNSIVATPALKDTTRRRLAGATIVSGSDWAFVSTDATVDFDARLTIKMAGPGDKAWFLAGRIRGRADLRECRRKTGAPRFPDGVETHDVLTAWKAGFGAGAFLPLTLGVSIDVPEKGFDPDETRCYEDCRELGRTLFIGMGRVTFQDGPNGAPESIELDLHRWRPPVKIASNKSQVVPSKARRGGV